MSRVFVYGTLKSGFSAHQLLQAARFVDGQFALNCALDDQGSFPGMVFEAGNRVWGEVYEVDDDTLQSLDHYEGVAHGLYRREEVELYDGSKALAYLFNRDHSGRPKVESGVWDELPG